MDTNENQAYLLIKVVICYLKMEDESKEGISVGRTELTI